MPSGRILASDFDEFARLDEVSRMCGISFLSVYFAASFARAHMCALRSFGDGMVCLTYKLFDTRSAGTVCKNHLLHHVAITCLCVPCRPMVTALCA